MSEIHQLSESDESAEEFLQRLSRGIASPAGRPVPRAGQSGRGSSATQPRPISLQDILTPASRPWIPATASLGIWGGGQWVNGQRSLALLFLVLEILTAAVAYCVYASWRSWVALADVFFIGESQLQMAMFWAGALVPAITIVGVVQAYVHACRHRRVLSFGGPSPVPMLASALIPGWGQMLNGEGGKAALFLVVWLSGLYTLGVSLLQPAFWSAFDPTPRVQVGYELTALQMGALAAVGLALVVSVYDALLSARRQRVG